MTNNALPTSAEVRDALRVIERATEGIRGMMQAAGIPQPSCLVTEGVVKSVVAVHMRSSERLFVSDGKVNCQSGYAGYDDIARAIETAAAHLQAKKAKRR